MTEGYTGNPNCGLCGVSYATHVRCRGCGIYCGPNHFQEGVVRYRGRLLCALCIACWQRLERQGGRQVPWEKFVHAGYPRGNIGLVGRGVRS